MIPLALTLFAGIFLLLALYIHRWLTRLIPAPTRGRRIAVRVASLLLTLLSFAVFSTFGMVLLHFWLLSALWDLVLLCARKRPGWRLRTLVPAALTLVLTIWGIYNVSNPVQTRYVYETEKVTQPYRAVLISDTHYDTIQSTDVLAEAIDEINGIDPDFVVLCGDIVEEGTSREKMAEAFRVLGGLQSRYGTYYIYGNHDRQTYSGSPKYTVAEMEAAMAEAGIVPLKNDYVNLNGEILLAGMEDPSWNREDPRMPLEAILPDGADEKLIIAADHQPNLWRESAAAGMDLQLSGHTHAGQVWPVGALLEATGLNYGRYDLDGCTVIVSSGFAGWGFPLRTSERSEYVVIDIFPAK